MEIIVAKLKNDFNNIITIRTTVKNIFDILQIRIDKLKQLYTEFIASNKNEIFIFGLDSFYFQTKLLDIEYYDMKRLFLAINNRMYCEYFKLHKIIVEYIQKNIDDNKNNNIIKINKYPTYKDLEPFKEYDFEAILDIHENIMNLISVSISILNNKENELFIYKTKQNIGLNIDNFISTFAFNNIVMREKIQMFTRYIEFFHKMHTKYLKRFSNKIHLMYTNINNDIKFDDSIEISKHKKKELIDEITTGQIDDELLKDLKTSIGSETNSENESDHTPGKTPKKSYKDMFKRNVKKASTIFKLFKPKEDTSKILGENISNTELDTLFSTINKSCATIINDDEHSTCFDLDVADTTLDEPEPEPDSESKSINDEPDPIDH